MIKCSDSRSDYYYRPRSEGVRMERRALLLPQLDHRKYGSFSPEEQREEKTAASGRPKLGLLISVFSSGLTLFLLLQLNWRLLLETSSVVRGTLVISAPLAGLITETRGCRPASILGALILSLASLMTSLAGTYLEPVEVVVMTGGSSLLLISVITSLLETFRPNYRAALAVILAAFVFLLHLPSLPLPLTPWLWPVLPVLALLTQEGRDGGRGADSGDEGGGGGGGGGGGDSWCVSTTVILAVVLAVMSLLLTGGQVLPLLLPPCLVVVGVLTDLASPSSPLLHCRTSLWLASPLPALLAVTSESPLISLAVSLGLVVLLTSWNLTAATASLSSLPLSLGLLTSVMAGLVSSPLTSLGLSSPELSLATASCLLALAGALYHLAGRLRYKAGTDSEYQTLDTGEDHHNRE